MSPIRLNSVWGKHEGFSRTAGLGGGEVIERRQRESRKGSIADRRNPDAERRALLDLKIFAHGSDERALFHPKPFIHIHTRRDGVLFIDLRHIALFDGTLRTSNFTPVDLEELALRVQNQTKKGCVQAIALRLWFSSTAPYFSTTTLRRGMTTILQRAPKKELSEEENQRAKISEDLLFLGFRETNEALLSLLRDFPLKLAAHFPKARDYGVFAEVETEGSLRNERIEAFRNRLLQIFPTPQGPLLRTLAPKEPRFLKYFRPSQLATWFVHAAKEYFSHSILEWLKHALVKIILWCTAVFGGYFGLAGESPPERDAPPEAQPPITQNIISEKDRSVPPAEVKEIAFSEFK